MPESEVIKTRTQATLSKFIIGDNPDTRVQVVPPDKNSITCRQCVLPQLVSFQVGNMLKTRSVSKTQEASGAISFKIEDSHPTAILDCDKLGDQIRSRARITSSEQFPRGRAFPDLSLSAEAACTRFSPIYITRR